MPAKYQTIGGVATLVQHRGQTTLPEAPPDTSGGPVVFCLHEAGMGGGSFADLLDALEDGHSPISFDRPGHGRSGALDSLTSVSAMADHANGLLEAFDLTGVTVVGEGLGAAIAIRLASVASERVAGLVLLGGVAASYDLADEIDALAAITAGRARREFDRTGYAPETDRSVYQKAFGVWVKTDPRATVGERRAQADWSVGPDEGSVSTPVVVVIGEHEEAASAEAARALADSLPNGSTTILAGAGRRGVLEQPGALATVIAEATGAMSR